MKRFLMIAAAALLPSFATAADLPVKAIPAPYMTQTFAWSGFYVGAHAGWEFGAFDPGFTTNNAALGAAVASLTDPGVLGPNASGGFGGAQLGFKYQTGNVVWDLRSKFSASGLQGSITDPATMTTVTHSVIWHGDLTLGLGYSITPTTLFYGRGGVAFGEIKDAANSAILAATLGSVPAVASDNVHVGWTAGLGIEHAFAGTPLSVFLEWDYTNLGTHGVTFVGPGAAATTFNINDKAAWNSVMGGINWKLF